MDTFEILCAIAVAFLATYYYFTSKFDYWKERGIRGPKPTPVFGNLKDLMFGYVSLGDFLTELYQEFRKEPAIGIFARRTPLLVLHDAEMIKDVLIRDFSSFADRGMTIHERTEPLSQHLFSLEPKRWRPLRTRLSPVFTSGKLKEMFSLILACSKHLEEYLEVLVKRGEPIECRDLTAKFTTDVIGTCAFGIEMKALADDDSEFRRVGKKVFSTDFVQLLKLRIRQSTPWLYDLLGYVVPQTEVSKFFTKVVKDTMEYRKKNNIVRHDFIDILLDLERNPDKLADVKLTDTLLAAQAFVFFAAGFETSSTTISNALYELALNQDIQQKLRAEIDEEYEKNNGELAYEDIKKMTYLDGVFRETLRKYPPVTVLMRKATSDYTFKSQNFTISKNMRVWIPIYAIQRDPDHYPEPEKFQPERFIQDAAATRNPMYYLPFGDGPRNCIGARFAVYQSKIGLIKIIRNYKVDICEKTMIPYVNDPAAFLLAPKGGIYVKMTKVQKSS